MVLSGDCTIPSLNLVNFNTEEIVASYCLPFNGKLHTPRRLDSSYPYPLQRLFCHHPSSGLEAIDLVNDLSESVKAITRKFSHSGHRTVGNEERHVIELLDVTMAAGKIWMWERAGSDRISVSRTTLDSETSLADDTINVFDEVDQRILQLHHLTNSMVLRQVDGVHDLYDLNKKVSVSAIEAESDLLSVSDFGYVPNNSNWPIRICSRFPWWYFVFGDENYFTGVASTSIAHVECSAFLSEYHVIIGGKVAGGEESIVEYYDLRKGQEGILASFSSKIDTPLSFARHPFDSNRCLYVVEKLPHIAFDPINCCKQLQFDGSSALTSHPFLSNGFEGLQVKQTLTLDEPFNISAGGRFSIPREGSLYLNEDDEGDDEVLLSSPIEINDVDGCSGYPPFCCCVQFDSGESGLLFFNENLQLDGEVQFRAVLNWWNVFMCHQGYAIHQSKEMIALYDRVSSTPTLILVVNRQIVFQEEMPRKVHQFGFLQDCLAIRFEDDEGETQLFELMPQNDELVLRAVISDPDQVPHFNVFGTDPETNSLFFIVGSPFRLVEYSVTSNHELEFVRDWEIRLRGLVFGIEVTSCYVKIHELHESSSYQRRSSNDDFDDEIWNSECVQFLQSPGSTIHSFVVNDHGLDSKLGSCGVHPSILIDELGASPIFGGQNAKRMVALCNSNLMMAQRMILPRQLPDGVKVPCFPKLNPSKKAQWLCCRPDGSLQLCSSDDRVIKTIVSHQCYSILLFGTNRIDYDPILFSSSTALGGFLAVPIETKRSNSRGWRMNCQAQFNQIMNRLAVSIINPTKMLENLKIEDFVAFNHYGFQDDDTQQVESVLIGNDLVAVKPLKETRFWVTSRSICMDLQIPLHHSAEVESEKTNEFLHSLEEVNLRCKVIESQLLAYTRFEMDPDELFQNTVDSLLFELDESFGVFGVTRFLNSLSVTTARMMPFNRDHPLVCAEILDDTICSTASDLSGSEFYMKSIPREIATYYLCHSVRGNVRQVPERFEIKLCASRLNDGDRLSIVTRTLGSVGRVLSLKGASFGLVHVYPTVGPLRIHWDTSNKVTLTLERRQNVVIRLKLHEFVIENHNQQQELFSLFEKLAHYIDHCNQNVSYDMQGDRKPNRHNCQSFSISVLNILMGGFKNRVPTVVYEYLTKTLPSLIAADESVRRLDLKKIQIGKFRFGQLFPGVVDRVLNLGAGCKIQKSRFLRRLNWISFSSSAEIRLFMDLLEEKYCDFRFLFPGEWRLLEGFSTKDEERGLRISEVIRYEVVAPFIDNRWAYLL